MTTSVVAGDDTRRGHDRSQPVAAVIGPDMLRLRHSYPPRPRALTWPMTELATEAVLARLLSAPFTSDIADSRDGLLRRQRGMRGVLSWLATCPGDTWQARWLASGADAMSNAGWVRPALVSGAGRGGDGVTVTSGLRVCAQILVSADVIRPSLGWILTPRAPQNLVALMARLRDPAGFAELTALCETSGAGRTMKQAALRRAATILAVKGGTLRDITVGDCLELSTAIEGGQCVATPRWVSTSYCTRWASSDPTPRHGCACSPPRAS